MTASVMWKSPEARAQMQQWHQRFAARLPASIERRSVTTSWGNTQVLVGGPVDAPPLLLFHGALASSAHVLVELAGLLEHHRVYAVDVIGQSAMGADARLDVYDDSHGRFVVEVADALGLAAVDVVGVSWGGFVAHRFAALAPARVKRLVLVVPAGVVASPRWSGFWRMGLPMTRYLLAPSPSSKAALLAQLMTTRDDADWNDSIGDAFVSANLRTMQVPPLCRAEEFAALTAPVFVVGADRDVSFPGVALLERARAVFPTLRDTHLLTETQHSPPTTPEFRAAFAARLHAWLS